MKWPTPNPPRDGEGDRALLQRVVEGGLPIRLARGGPPPSRYARHLPVPGRI